MTNIEKRMKDYKNIVKVISYKEYEEEYIYDDKTNEYFHCIESMEEYYKDKNLEIPKYAYGTYFEPIKLDLDYILENACEEHHEDALSSLDCVEELRTAINKFNEDNKNNGSYYEDINTIVELFC